MHSIALDRFNEGPVEFRGAKGYGVTGPVEVYSESSTHGSGADNRYLRQGFRTLQT